MTDMKKITELKLRNVLLRKACLEKLDQEDYDNVIKEYKESLKTRGIKYGDPDKG